MGAAAFANTRNPIQPANSNTLASGMMGNDRGRVGTNGAACDEDSVTGSSVGECWVIVGCTVLVGGMAFWIASCGLGAIRRVATGCVAVADCMP